MVRYKERIPKPRRSFARMLYPKNRVYSLRCHLQRRKHFGIIRITQSSLTMQQVGDSIVAHVDRRIAQ